MKKYEQIVYLWKKFNPSKKFKEFYFEELNDFSDVSVGFCNKNEILLIKGDFFIYSGEIKNHWDDRRKPIIRFKNRAKVVAEIPA